jgi:hypothetical protein
MLLMPFAVYHATPEEEQPRHMMTGTRQKGEEGKERKKEKPTQGIMDIVGNNVHYGAPSPINSLSCEKKKGKEKQ